MQTLSSTTTSPAAAIHLTVYEFNKKNFNRDGRLSKRAHPILDHYNCQVIGAEGMATVIRQNLPKIVEVVSPYVFTHILIKTIGPDYIVFEHVQINGTELITSPTALLAELKKQTV